MIQDQLLQQFALLLKAAPTPLIRVTDAAATTAADARWSPGDRLPATVLTSLTNGRFQVQVDNQTLEMNLPKNTQPGDQMELVYVGNSPRLTFTLAAVLPAAQPASLLPPAAAEAPAPALAADLSETAHLLGQLSQQAEGTTREIQAQTPVLPGPPSDIRQLAAALQKTIAISGLFYEAHQAQWVQGERPLEMLLREPQAQQGQALQGPAPQVSAQPGQALSDPAQQGQVPSDPVQQGQSPVFHIQPDAGLSNRAQPPAASPNAQLPGQTPATTLAATGVAATQGDSSTAVGLPGLDSKIAGLLQQQLQLLNTGTIHWSGQVWPGQQMQWEISGMPASQPEGSQQWQTKLNLTLPNLGAVSAWLLIGPQGLQIRMQADEAQTRQSLVASAAALDAALQSASLSLVHFTVEQND